LDPFAYTGAKPCPREARGHATQEVLGGPPAASVRLRLGLEPTNMPTFFTGLFSSAPFEWIGGAVVGVCVMLLVPWLKGLLTYETQARKADANLKRAEADIKTFALEKDRKNFVPTRLIEKLETDTANAYDLLLDRATTSWVVSAMLVSGCTEGYQAWMSGMKLEEESGEWQIGMNRILIAILWSHAQRTDAWDKDMESSFLKFGARVNIDQSKVNEYRAKGEHGLDWKALIDSGW